MVINESSSVVFAACADASRSMSIVNTIGNSVTEVQAGIAGAETDTLEIEKPGVSRALLYGVP